MRFQKRLEPILLTKAARSERKTLFSKNLPRLLTYVNFSAGSLRLIKYQYMLYIFVVVFIHLSMK